jgi:ATP-binding cassette subfamily B protein
MAVQPFLFYYGQYSMRGSKIPYLHLLKTSWRFSKGRRHIFVVTYIFFIIANVLILLEPLIIGRVFNEIQMHEPDALRRIITLLIIAGSLPFFFWIFHGTARVMERTTAFHIIQRAREYYFKIVTQLPLRWHKDHHSGETQDKIEKATRGLEQFAEKGFTYVETATRAIVSAVAILLYVPRYGFLILGIGAIIVFAITRFDKRLTAMKRNINKREHAVAATFYDYVSNIKTIITLRLEKFARLEYSNAIAKIFPVLRREIRFNEVKWFSVSMFITISNTAILTIFIVRGWNSGTLLLGSLVALYGYVRSLSDTFFHFTWQAQEVLVRSVNVSAVDSIVEAHQAMGVKPTKKFPIDNWKKIEISGVWFTYEDQQRKEHQLEDVHMEIGRGQRIALVGASGSGKSTLLHLLRGLDTPKKALVKVDDKKMPGMQVLSQMTTLMPQDPEIFENTIAYNVAAGTQHRKTELNEAVRLARFESVLKRLPRGLETHIKEKGVNLSGGEKQRLALARGIFAARESSLILMDEPTSSVDTLNELAIYKNAFAHFKGQAIVSTIHRLHLLPQFDYIYMLDAGRVVEEGTFEELWRKPGGMLAHQWQQYQQAEKEVSRATEESA